MATFVNELALPPLQARRRRPAEIIPQLSKNHIKGRKSFQEPGPRTLYHSVRSGASVARAAPVEMTGPTDRLPRAWNGAAKSSASLGTRRSRGWLRSRNCPPRWSCQAIAAAYLVIHVERSRSDGNRRNRVERLESAPGFGVR